MTNSLILGCHLIYVVCVGEPNNRARSPNMSALTRERSSCSSLISTPFKNHWTFGMDNFFRRGRKLTLRCIKLFWSVLRKHMFRDEGLVAGDARHNRRLMDTMMKMCNSYHTREMIKMLFVPEYG